MNIIIFSFLVFSVQFNLNDIDEDANNRMTPTMIMSIDRIINTFINLFLYINF